MNKMILGCYLLALSILNVYAAPADNVKQVLKESTKTQEQPKSDEIYNEHKSPPSVRQKRLFNPYGFGFPPISPIIYQNSRGGYGYNSNGAEDPSQQIHRRLQQLSSPPFAVAPAHFPFFFPVIFVPQVGCGCNNNRPNQNPNNTNPGVDTRFPAIDDSRQNWGFVVDNNLDGPSVGNNDLDEDISRPISFDPVPPNRPMNRPRPPVDHGSTQAGTTSQSPAQSSPAPPQAQPASKPPENSISTTTNRFSLYPNKCDAALLTCCHEVRVGYDCFEAQGCPYTRPCNPDLILSVIEKFQRYYGPI